MIGWLKDLWSSARMLSGTAIALEVRENRRLQRLLWGVGYIVVFYFMLVVSDAAVPAATEAERLVRNLERLNAHAQAGDWVQERAAESRVNAVLSEKFWEAETPGLASADLQTLLSSAVTRFDVQNYRLKMGEPSVDSVGDDTIWSIQGELVGTITLNSMPLLLAFLEDGDKSVTVDRVLYAPGRGNLLNLLVTIRARRVQG